VNRNALARTYESSEKPWKTYLVEAHTDGDINSFLSDAFHGARVEATDDAFMSSVRVLSDNGSLNMTVDHLDRRYLSVHTTDTVALVRPTLQRTIDTNPNLDWVWLPAGQMRELWPGIRRASLKVVHNERHLLDPDEGEDFSISFRGTSARAERLKTELESAYGSMISPQFVGGTVVDEDFDGYVNEALTRKGQFVSTGTSFALHQAIVAGVRDRYAAMIDAIEDTRLRCTSFGDADGGGSFTGSPILLTLQKRITNVELFASRLFSAREPFRLWGVPTIVEPDYVIVDAVDLHVGQTLRIEVAPTWLRVILHSDTCGNTVARLVSNLQRHFDAALRIGNPELAARFGSPVSTLA
jgi:hypothetical protein